MSLISHDITKLNQQSFWPADLFICSSSFEERCLTIPRALNVQNVKKILIVENANIPQVRKNAITLKEIFPNSSVKINISTDDPLLTADNLMEGITNSILKTERNNIVIDITTFTHESLLILLNIIHKIFDKYQSITFLYNSAQDYSIGDSIQKKWLSNGVKGVRSVLGFPGDIKPNKKNHLILFVGYESKRATQLIEELEPNEISLGYGEPGTATNEKHEEASKYFHRIVQEMFLTYSNINSFSFSCNNPIKAKKTILEQVNRFPDHNIIIAPMNTKLSTVGSALAALENDQIQLCYAPAVQYNFSNYSLPSDRFYFFNTVLSHSRSHNTD